MISRILLLVALVLATGIESAARASCAKHGMGAVDTQAQSAGAHGIAKRHIAHHHGQPPAHDHADGCCCAGDCSGMAPIARIPATSTIRVAVVVAGDVDVLDPRDHRAPVAEPDRLLPFANGPPTDPAV